MTGRAARTRIGHVGRRHPRCPWCGYDLVATVAESRDVCPECGQTFERDELVWETLPGDWTAGRGLRRFAAALFLRSLVIVIAWTGLLCGIAATVNAVRPKVAASIGTGLGIVAGLLVLLAGAAVGHYLAKGINDAAGFESALVTVATAITAFVVLWFGVAVAFRYGLIGGVTGGALIVLGGALAVWAVVHETVFADA